MTGQTPPKLFDRPLLHRRIARARSRRKNDSLPFDDIADQLNERLEEIKRPFQNALDLSPFPFLSKRGGNAFDVLTPDPLPDEENLTFGAQRFDLIVNNLGLHWANDLPKALTQCYVALRPKGLFLASLVGGQSLCELRECLMEAELSSTGGVSPRLSPMIDLKTAGDLLRRANFHLPVADIETLTLLYPDMYALMRDLRGSGQTNALLSRPKQPTRRIVFTRAAQLYRERFADSSGLLRATLDIIYLHGWK